MDDTPAVAMVVDDYFEQAEMEDTRELLQQAGFKVDLIATKDVNLQSMDGDTKKGDRFRADLLIDSADPDDYDAVVLPGGVINSDRLRMDRVVRQFLVELDESDKIIAAICHAPWVLISADLVEGRTMTSFPSLEHDLKNAGALWLDKSVVIEGNLITSRHPGDVQEFSEAIIDLLGEDIEEEL